LLLKWLPPFGFFIDYRSNFFIFDRNELSPLEINSNQVVLATGSGVICMSHIKHGVVILEKDLSHYPVLSIDVLPDNWDMARFDPIFLLIDIHMLVRNKDRLININVNLH
jgi:hypothetical protein